MLDAASPLGGTLPAMTGIQGAAHYGFSDSDLAVATNVGLLLRDQKVFRTGTFTSMHGRTRTWTADDLDIAVANFYELQRLNIVPNVPVREDHTTSIKDVVGYFTSVRRDGDFLLADWEWATEEAKGKWETKKYRNRSIEIGAYTANDGTTYDPVVLGLAFVDHPAVEGLYRIANSGDDMATNENTPAAQAAADQAAADKVVADKAAADQAVADKAASDKVVADKAAADQAAADKAAADAAGPAAHANAQMQVHAFTVQGSQVHDYARVQAHITELETFRKETVEGARKNFVDKLVSDKIVTGPQGVAFHGLVQTMNVEQFAAFQAGFEGMQSANLFAKHDLSGGGSDGGPDDAKADRIVVLEAIVANHRATGMSAEDMAKKSSFIELQTLKNS